MKNSLFCLFVLSMFILGGCPKPTPAPTPIPTTYPNTFTIDGGSFHNQVIPIKVVTSSNGQNNANGQNYTQIEIFGNSDTFTNIHIEIRFTGSSSGPYNFNIANEDYVSIAVTTQNNPNPIQYNSLDGTGSINVGSYGAVGGQISGSFHGKFDGNGTTYTIPSGAFSVTRAQ